MTRNAIVDALGVLKAGRIVDPTHLVHPGIQRFGPFRAMRIETRYTVAESGFHVDAPTSSRAAARSSASSSRS